MELKEQIIREKDNSIGKLKTEHESKIFALQNEMEKLKIEIIKLNDKLHQQKNQEKKKNNSNNNNNRNEDNDNDNDKNNAFNKFDESKTKEIQKNHRKQDNVRSNTKNINVFLFCVFSSLYCVLFFIFHSVFFFVRLTNSQ